MIVLLSCPTGGWIEAEVQTYTDHADAKAALSWFKTLTPHERTHWLAVARSATLADTWRAFKAEPSLGPDC